MMVRPDFFIADMLGWCLALLGLVFLAELALAGTTLRYVIVFFRALLPGQGPVPATLEALCGKMVTTWGVLVVGLGGLCVVFVRDYAGKADLTAGPWSGHILGYEMLILLRYQYLAVVFVPAFLGISSLAVWLYMYAYARRRSTVANLRSTTTSESTPGARGRSGSRSTPPARDEAGRPAP